MESQKSIASLKFVNCYQHFARFQNPLPASFPELVRMLSNLVVLKLDYGILCNGVVDAILMNGNINLEDMVVCIKENDIGNEEIEEEKWLMLSKQCPNVKVSFHFRKNSTESAVTYTVCGALKIGRIIVLVIPTGNFEKF